MFGVEGLAVDDEGVRAEMVTGSLSAGLGGAGSLGVLADVVLGYSIILGTPTGLWSVSAEISVDFCLPLPPMGTKLTARGRAVHLATTRGLGEGSIVDPDGRLVARTRQWGRFVDRAPDPTYHDDGVRLAGVDGPAAERHAEGIHERVTAEDGHAVLEIDVSDMLVNPINSLHGGVALWLVEVTADAAVSTLHPMLSPTSLTVTYLRPLVRHDVATFRAEVVHRGRSLALTRVTATNRVGKTCLVASVHHQS